MYGFGYTLLINHNADYLLGLTISMGKSSILGVFPAPPNFEILRASNLLVVYSLQVLYWNTLTDVALSPKSMGNRIFRCFDPFSDFHY